MKAKNFEKLKLTTDDYNELLNLCNGVMFKKAQPVLLQHHDVTPFEELVSIPDDIELCAKIADLTFAQADFLLDSILYFWSRKEPGYKPHNTDETLVALYNMSSEIEPEKQEWIELHISNCCHISIHEKIAKIISYKYHSRHSAWHIVALIGIPYDIESKMIWDDLNEDSECLVMEVDLDLLEKIAPKTVLSLDVNKYNV